MVSLGAGRCLHPILDLWSERIMEKPRSRFRVSLVAKFAIVTILLGIMPIVLLTTVMQRRMLTEYRDSLERAYRDAIAYSAYSIRARLDNYTDLSKFCYYYNYFSTRFIGFKVSHQLGQSTTHGFFVYLGNFTRNRRTTLCSKIFNELCQRFHKSVWRFIEHHRTIFLCQGLQPCHPSFFLRQETFKTEFLVRQS